MSLYSLVKPLLFKLNPENAHKLTLSALKVVSSFIPTSHFDNPSKVMGINFPNPVGLAAGLDKNGAYINSLAQLGFGFIEIGTVTPEPQSGQPRPRLFRLISHEALINRMGFNNNGVETVIENIKKQSYSGILGINIGKNAKTPLENAKDDYQICFAKFYSYADYITINISSPNTEGLRTLQSTNYLKDLLDTLKNQQSELTQKNKIYVPLVLKLSPDLNEEEIESIAKQVIDFEIDGVAAVNTTVSRKQVKNSQYAEEKGGLSGEPLNKRSTEVIKQLYAALGEKVPIMASGGIMSSQNAIEKITAGAKLVQLYTGLIYKGPSLIREINSAINKK